jgi:hypothetical protein
MKHSTPADRLGLPLLLAGAAGGAEAGGAGGASFGSGTGGSAGTPRLDSFPGRLESLPSGGGSGGGGSLLGFSPRAPPPPPPPLPRSPYMSFECPQDADITEEDCDSGGPPAMFRPRQGPLGQGQGQGQGEEEEEEDALEKLLTTDVRIAVMLKGFVPAPAAAAIESNTLQYLGELRSVVTLFIQVVGLEADFSEGLIDR